MIQRLSNNQVYVSGIAKKQAVTTPSFGAKKPVVQNKPLTTNSSVINQIQTTLNEAQKQKYIELLDVLKNVPPRQNSFGLTPAKQLDMLLKNGKLLAKSPHDNSTTLDNLHSMATTKRAYDLDRIVLLTSTLDILSNPKTVTQTFGDIPDEIQPQIIQHLDDNDPVKSNPREMNVYSSGTCAAASIEVTMADKYPAEFARWVSDLSSEKKSTTLKVKLDSISKNKLEAVNILNILQIQNLVHPKLK